MKQKTERLFWNGKLVGVVSNPKVDMWDYYGSWQPTSDEALYRQFLEQVDQEGGARVEIGEVGSPLSATQAATVELEPDDEIQVKLRPLKRAVRIADGS
ncbi:MAG: hypothetical protein RL291_462 [Pseudomonadota bacterium]